MSPEYGPRTAYFPVDKETLRYLKITSRSPSRIKLVEKYCKKIGIFRDPSFEPNYTEVTTTDLSEDRISLAKVKEKFSQILNEYFKDCRKKGKSVNPYQRVSLEFDDMKVELKHGDVVIAAITGCVYASNLSLRISAGLLTKKVENFGLIRNRELFHLDSFKIFFFHYLTF